MPRRLDRRPFVLAILLLLAAFNAAARDLPGTRPEEQGVSSEHLQRLNELAKQYVDEGRVPGIVNLVLRNGKVIHYEATGARGVDDATAMRPDDLFRIYSMTKPITAVAAMQLYEQGKFQLTDPVAKFVPELENLRVLEEGGALVPARRQATMHDLLMHTAGFSYGFAFAVDAVDERYIEADLLSAKDLDAFVEALARIPLKFHPGDRWHYSVAVDVTGLVVERLSGQRLDDYFQEHIFTPLGMEDTFFEVPAGKRDRLTQSHFFNPQTGQLVDTADAPPPFNYREKVSGSDFFDVSLHAGGHGLVSSAMDYARFAEMLRRGGSLEGERILSPKTVAFMTRNHLGPGKEVSLFGAAPAPALGRVGVGFGLGFGVITDSAAAGVLGSDGEYNWGGAAGTVFWVDPVEEIIAVSMIQLLGSPWPLRSDLKVGIYQALTEIYAE